MFLPGQDFYCIVVPYLKFDSDLKAVPFSVKFAFEVSEHAYDGNNVLWKPKFKDLDDEAVACIALVSSGAILIAQEGLNCAVDGFMRLLTRLDLEQIESAVGVLASERYACVLNSAQNFDWIFLRSPDQVDRFLAALQRLGVSFYSL
uniref:Uncharacterized protein n=1 Tax=Parascaris equorum TaxID=6256 RepID=A0A914S0E7_PAREQ